MRQRFEEIYARSDDPWRYGDSPYERAKYEDTLAALPGGPIGRALEVGCSIGVFTEMLAPRCRELIAIDFSERALELGAQRLARLTNVQALQASFPEQAPAGDFELVVCSEVLYYLDRETLDDAIGWLRSQLQRGASVLAVSWRGRGRDEPLLGDEAHDLLAAELSSWHALDGRDAERADGREREHYRLDRFDGDGR
jgi:SAM-dependent methyltransferase